MFATQQMQIHRLQPHEAARVVDDVFGRLSLESRRLRFHTPMPRMPSYARQQLTQIDDWSHVAVAAWVDDQAVAIGRFVCVTADEAEVALEVADAWHGLGIGRRILLELTREASDLGYRRLLADVLPENAAMLRLLRDVFPDARVSRSDGVVRVTCPLGASAGESMAAVPAPG
jgi:GNAT superfamily N-acetyltransferase